MFGDWDEAKDRLNGRANASQLQQIQILELKESWSKPQRISSILIDLFCLGTYRCLVSAPLDIAPLTNAKRT